jgi:hypothetical protein
MPDISSLIMQEKGGSANDMILSLVKQTQEYMRKTVKELQLTVHTKVGSKEVPFTVATYFVDYTQQFNIPGLPGGADTPGPGGGENQGSTPPQTGNPPGTPPTGQFQGGGR